MVDNECLQVMCSRQLVWQRKLPVHRGPHCRNFLGKSWEDFLSYDNLCHYLGITIVIALLRFLIFEINALLYIFLRLS